MVIGFVLLNYNSIKMTLKSVQYIKALNRGENQIIIIIVDNNSSDNSVKELKHRFVGDNLVEVILNSENKGFAKGNNDGYHMAKLKYNADYIIVMNNDIFIRDTNFIIQLLSSENDVEVIAPDIILPNDKHQNPLRFQAATKDNVQKIYNYNKFMCLFYKIPILNFLAAILLDIKSKNKGDNRTSETAMENITPHGACIIYTNKWIINEDIAFLPDTFLFMEEDHLMHYIVSKKYKTLFKPDLKVYHMPHSSIKATYSNRVKKRLFFAENMKESAYSLLKKM